MDKPTYEKSFKKKKMLMIFKIWTLEIEANAFILVQIRSKTIVKPWQRY